jgi:hypothetical protein
MGEHQTLIVSEKLNKNYDNLQRVKVYTQSGNFTKQRQTKRLRYFNET